MVESPGGLPERDQLVVPNGCPRLILPYQNSLTRITDGGVHTVKEQGAYFSGITDRWMRVRSSAQPTGVIGVEFRSEGAHAVLGISMDDTAHRLLRIDEILGRRGELTLAPRGEVQAAQRYVAFIQTQLIALVNRCRRRNDIVEFCVSQLRRSHGRVTIGALTRETGFSRRYVDRLFNQYVGCSPKTLARIFRFHRFYRLSGQEAAYEPKNDVYDYYCDQSHFSNEFKRMTGTSPRRFAAEGFSDFGRHFAVRERDID
jgi:AraC-like DNA-binding protein